MAKDVWKVCAAPRLMVVMLGLAGAFSFIGSAESATINVAPKSAGRDEGPTIQDALAIAQPGDTIVLSPGTYMQDFRSVRDGQLGKPITIEGSLASVVKGGGQPRVIEINHSYIELRNFTVDGRFERANTKKSYRDKLLYVIGNTPGKELTGLRVLGMDIRNAGGECVRLRYQARQNEIAYSRISSCGRFDFLFDDGGKNGEGIYIGTAPEQLGGRGAPDGAIDRSDRNRIHDNVIATGGNECVDIKEGSSGNIVEKNSCTGQKDPNSGGFDSRGNSNVFRYNLVYDVVGAGVRLGGDEESDGVNNDVYGNTFRNVGVGLIRAQRAPQGKICENISQNNRVVSTNSISKTLDATGPCDGPKATADLRSKPAASSNRPEVAKETEKGGAPLSCSPSVAGCVIGRLEGDDRNRIKIVDASDVVLRGHHLILSDAVGPDGKAMPLKALAGKLVRLEYTSIEKKRFAGAKIIEVVN
ncbi:hypothetical protein QO004_001840 [Rhizobium mesoamericanum]|uniref:right-handed parallel beta-helix repeat-containing protein n=1 Tax=Rhizobium mesoamericanum TaxID=1079800 RepID=UPI002789FA23|nr:hypothetical protein [Rhizobium mesoamericanum]MDQ0560058.1 hypothetical protein [Rhizobium mesoamericanum]